MSGVSTLQEKLGILFSDEVIKPFLVSKCIARARQKQRERVFRVVTVQHMTAMSHEKKWPETFYEIHGCLIGILISWFLNVYEITPI